MNNVLKFRQRDYELPDDLISISNFAQKYGCSKSLIYKLKNKGRIRLYPIGHYKISECETLRVLGV